MKLSEIRYAIRFMTEDVIDSLGSNPDEDYHSELHTDGGYIRDRLVGDGIVSLESWEEVNNNDKFWTWFWFVVDKKVEKHYEEG